MDNVRDSDTKPKTSQLLPRHIQFVELSPVTRLVLAVSSTTAVVTLHFVVYTFDNSGLPRSGSAV